MRMAPHTRFPAVASQPPDPPGPALFRPPVQITPKTLYDLPLTMEARAIIDSVTDWKILQETLRMELQRPLQKERRIAHLRRRVDILKAMMEGQMPTSQQGLPVAPQVVQEQPQPTCATRPIPVALPASIEPLNLDGLLPMVGVDDCTSTVPDMGEAAYARLVVQAMRSGNARVLAALIRTGRVRDYDAERVASGIISACKEGESWEIAQQVALFGGAG